MLLHCQPRSNNGKLLLLQQKADLLKRQQSASENIDKKCRLNRGIAKCHWPFEKRYIQDPACSK
jgi:hypothetical protein